MKRKVFLKSMPVEKLTEDEIQIVFEQFSEDFYHNKKALRYELNKRKIIRQKMIAIMNECEKRKKATLFNNLPSEGWFEATFYKKMSEEYFTILLEDDRHSAYYKEMSICSFKKDILDGENV